VALMPWEVNNDAPHLPDLGAFGFSPIPKGLALKKLPVELLVGDM